MVLSVVLASMTLAGVSPLASAPIVSSNVTTVAGIVGRAVHIAENGWLEYPFRTNTLGCTKGSLSLWVKLDWTPTGGHFYRDRDLDEKGDWSPVLNRSQQIRPLFRVGSRRGVSLTTGLFFGGRYSCGWDSLRWFGRIHADEWHHLALTYDQDSSRLRMYLDGLVLNERKVEKHEAAVFSRSMLIGCGPADGGLGGFPHPSLGGAVDGLRLFDRELTADEIGFLYAEGMPYRIELLDWSVPKGETRRLRFRVRNLSDKRLERDFVFSNGKHAHLALSAGELGEFAIDVTGKKRGLFTLSCNGGKPDCRVFEIYCLEDGDIGHRVSGSGKKHLIGEYDCARDYPTNLFNDCGSRVVTNAWGRYREGLSLDSGVGFMYRFDVRHPGRPHRIEVDYPDDAKREFVVMAYPEGRGRLFTASLDGMGILSGVDHPLSDSLQTKHLIFWPDSPAVQVGVLAYRPRPLSRPPAAAKIRLYELDGLPPSAGVSGKGHRTIGIWDEDPTMDAQLAFSQSFNFARADLDFWREKWARTIDYMRHMGLDTWVIKAMSYAGDVTDMPATFGHSSMWLGHDGRVSGWAELGADMLDRAGMDVWIRFNHKAKYGGWFGRLGGLRAPEDIHIISDKGTPHRGYEQSYDVDFTRPEVMEAYKRVIRAYRDKFCVYGHFRGITMNESPGLYFGDIHHGYGKWTVDLFAQETGIVVPETDAAGRFEFLTGDPSRRAKWVDWRCRKVTSCAKELVRTLREKGGNYQLQFWVWCSLFTMNETDWFGWNPETSLREAGVDLKALGEIDGLKVVPCVRPDRFRPRGDFDKNEYHFPYDDKYRDLLRTAGVSSVNVYRHSNLEIYTKLAAKSNVWHWAFTSPTGNNLAGIPNFHGFPTPHPAGKYALESMVGLIADYDLQDILHGFWGIPESGEHDRFRRLYAQFKAIPRGRYELVPGWNDPVAIRTGEGGLYLVNRESYPIEVSWKLGGEIRKTTLDGCELKWISRPGRVDAKDVTDVRCRIPDAELALLKSRWENVKGKAARYPWDRELADIIRRADAAMRDGRYTAARAYLWTGPVREALFTERKQPLTLSDRTLERLRSVKLRNGEVTSAFHHGQKDAEPSCLRSGPDMDVVRFVLRPTRESEIHCRLLLPPPERWSRRFWGVGNQGFGDRFAVWHVRGWMLPRAREGAAVCMSDMGTAGNRHGREVVRDFGWRANHEMTIAAKKLIAAYYGRPPEHCYFIGLSSGGGQGLHEAQRFPEDYEGIVSYVPAHYRTALAREFWNIYRQSRDSGGRLVITEKQCKTVVDAAIEYFAPREEAYASGRLITAPTFSQETAEGILDLAARQCPELNSEDLRRRWISIWKGPRIDGRYPCGLSFDSDLSEYLNRKSFIQRILTGTAGKSLLAMSISELEHFISDVKPDVDADSTDLSGFRTRGGKLILVSGLSDQIVPARTAWDYCERLAASMGGAKALESFFRAYFLPGRGHCSRSRGHDGIADIPAAKALVDWCEKGIPPGTLTGRVRDGTKVPVAPWPMKTAGAVGAWKTVKMPPSVRE